MIASKGFSSNRMLSVFASTNYGVCRPLEPSCTCMTCKTYSRAFLHNLVAKGLPFASHLVTYHNVAYTQVLDALHPWCRQISCCTAPDAQHSPSSVLGNISLKPHRRDCVPTGPDSAHAQSSA